MKRREYIKFKNRYRQLKNVRNLDLLRQAGKVYKKEINKAFRKYKEKPLCIKSDNSKHQMLENIVP